MDRGLKILLNAYWDSKGWKGGSIAAEDFVIAKNEGYMFDYPNYEPHDDALHKAKEIAGKIDKQDVANAFLFSLTTRRLEYRSALGSYYYVNSIPEHTQQGACYYINSNPEHIHEDKKHCYICDWRAFQEDPDEYELNHGLNVLNFERHKWGGVRHLALNYANFDLEEFIKLPKVVPTDEDVRLLRTILSISKELPLKSKAGRYIKQICSKKIIKTNKAEITVLLEILGICDVFNSNEYKGFLHSFTANNGQRDPVELTNDIDFPLNRWHASDGINLSALNEVFGLVF